MHSYVFGQIRLAGTSHADHQDRLFDVLIALQKMLLSVSFVCFVVDREGCLDVVPKGGKSLIDTIFIIDYDPNLIALQFVIGSQYGKGHRNSMVIICFN